MISNNLKLKENRIANRYPMVLPVEFESGTGWTRDISTVGVCIETERPLQRGSAIQFSMRVPQTGDVEIRLQCDGIVLRTEPLGKRWRAGVAMTVVRLDDRD